MSSYKKILVRFAHPLKKFLPTPLKLTRFRTSVNRINAAAAVEIVQTPGAHLLFMCTNIFLRALRHNFF